MGQGNDSLLNLDIDYIEKYPEATLIYDFIKKAQIKASEFKGMTNDILIYIAGHMEPHPNMPDDERTRIRSNAISAQNELNRRSNRSTNILSLLLVVATVALVAATIYLANRHP